RPPVSPRPGAPRRAVGPSPARGRSRRAKARSPVTQSRASLERQRPESSRSQAPPGNGLGARLRLAHPRQRGRASKIVRSQAEPGNEEQTLVQAKDSGRSRARLASEAGADILTCNPPEKT